MQQQLRRSRCRWLPVRSSAMLLLSTIAALLLVVAPLAADAGDPDLVSDDTCVQSTPCRCANRHGRGIDLDPLAAVKYLATPRVADLTFYFHPCSDIDMQVVDEATNKTLTCQTSTLCVFNQTANATATFTSLGRVEHTEFHDTVTHRDQYYVVKLPGAHTISTLIQLGCTNVEADRLYYLPSENQLQYNLVLYSPHACMRSIADDQTLSTGAVLLIIFFTMAFGYVACGMMVNYFLVGARGIEMLPHLGFWRDLPSLVCEGVAFLQNGCQPAATRDDLLASPQTPNPNSYVSI